MLPSTIELDAHDLISVADLAPHYPRRPGGRKGVHPATITRWITKGVNGTKLPATRQGGKWITTLRAYRAFQDELTRRASDGAGALQLPPTPRRDSDAATVPSREQQQIEEELNLRYGI